MKKVKWARFSLKINNSQKVASHFLYLNKFNWMKLKRDKKKFELDFSRSLGLDKVWGYSKGKKIFRKSIL